jgi:hypothetical protein
MRLIRALVNGEWNYEEFLVVPPGQRIGGVFDWDRIVKAEELLKETSRDAGHPPRR